MPRKPKKETAFDLLRKPLRSRNEVKKKTVSKKKLTKKKRVEIEKRDRELIEKCLLTSPSAMSYSCKFEELIVYLAELSARNALFSGGDKDLLDFVYKGFFDTSLLSSLKSQFRNKNEKDLRIERRNALRGNAEIQKLHPLKNFGSRIPENINAAVEDVDAELLNIQTRLPALCEKYFQLRAKLLGQTEEKKKDDKVLESEIKQFMDKDRIIVMVNMLKLIGYTERQACITVKKLLEFSKYPEHVTWQAIQNRYKRARA